MEQVLALLIYYYLKVPMNSFLIFSRKLNAILSEYLTSHITKKMQSQFRTQKMQLLAAYFVYFFLGEQALMICWAVNVKFPLQLVYSVRMYYYRAIRVYIIDIQYLKDYIAGFNFARQQQFYTMILNMAQQGKSPRKFVAQILRVHNIQEKLQAISSEHKIKSNIQTNQPKCSSQMKSPQKKIDQIESQARKIELRLNRMQNQINNQIIDIQYEVKLMKDSYEDLAQKNERNCRHRKLLLQRNRKNIQEIKQRAVVELARSYEDQRNAQKQILSQFDFKIHLILQEMVQLTNARDIFVVKARKIKQKSKEQFQKYNQDIMHKDRKIKQLNTKVNSAYLQFKNKIKTRRQQQTIRFEKILKQIKNVQQIIKQQLNQERNLMQENKQRIIEAIQSTQKIRNS